jgi:hypothetical protein
MRIRHALTVSSGAPLFQRINLPAPETCSNWFATPTTPALEFIASPVHYPQYVLVGVKLNEVLREH